MDQLIPVINELQDTYSKLNMPFIDLPQIVIIGSQSTGKSSVLENIVKQEFLPRGIGIVTRCPLVLHLVHDSDSSKGPRGRFLHTGNYDYYDFNDIKAEIINQTDILAGSEKNISDQPITLTIYSHEFPNLTLIDLPGLTKVAVESQPSDIYVQIKNTCTRFARKENSIILAISAANVDLANSDAIHFAQTLDPEGKRTLCVITKLDMMDRYTNARDILTGKTLQKQLGYIGVVCRSQKDIIECKSIVESLCEEKQFLEANYPDISHQHGTAFLTLSLNKLLKRHIKQCLPNLKQTIRDKINVANQNLYLLGPEIIDKGSLIPDFLNNFTKSYIEINDGVFLEDFTENRGGAVISEIIYESFPNILMIIDIKDNLTDEIIMGAIKLTCGSNKMSFSREKAFMCLVKQQIDKLNYPSLECLDKVYDTMFQFVDLASKKFPFSNFPNLIEKIIHETHLLIKENYKITKSLITNLIKSEQVDVMCSHPNFKLGFVLENMNFTNIQRSENRPGDTDESGDNDMDQEGNEIIIRNHIDEKEGLCLNGFKVICKNIDVNIKEFCQIMLYYIDKANKTQQMINLLRNNYNYEEKTAKLNQMIENIFQDVGNVNENNIPIVEAILNENFKFLDHLMQFELTKMQNDLSELKTPVNKSNEYIILRTLVTESFNMVRQNICYYVPKLIKAFLVIHVKENLMSHLQKIYSEPDNDCLLFEAEDTYKKRKQFKALLEDLENVKQRIDEILCEN